MGWCGETGEMGRGGQRRRVRGAERMKERCACVRVLKRGRRSSRRVGVEDRHGGHVLRARCGADQIRDQTRPRGRGGEGVIRTGTDASGVSGLSCVWSGVCTLHAVVSRVSCARGGCPTDGCGGSRSWLTDVRAAVYGTGVPRPKRRSAQSHSRVGCATTGQGGVSAHRARSSLQRTGPISVSISGKAGVEGGEGGGDGDGDGEGDGDEGGVVRRV
jgi:hypothetical protein